MSHSQFRLRDLLFPPCLGWKEKSIWVPMAGDMARLSVTSACQDLPGPSNQFRLSSMCSEPKNEIFLVLLLPRSNTSASGVNTVFLGVTCYLPAW